MCLLHIKTGNAFVIYSFIHLFIYFSHYLSIDLSVYLSLSLWGGGILVILRKYREF